MKSSTGKRTSQRNAILGIGLIGILAALLIPQQQEHNPITGRITGNIEYTFTYAENDPVTGTTPFRLVSISSTTGKAVTTPDGADAALGVCVKDCGTSGMATIARSGDSLCDFDGPTTLRNLVAVGATGGKCTDLGQSVSAPWPTRRRIVGVVLSTNASAGRYKMAMFPNGIRGSYGGIRQDIILDFPNTVAFTCEELTASVPGAVEGEAVVIGAPSVAYNGDNGYEGRVSAANTVSIRHCTMNNAFNPPSTNFKLRIIQP